MTKSSIFKRVRQFVNGENKENTTKDENIQFTRADMLKVQEKIAELEARKNQESGRLAPKKKEDMPFNQAPRTVNKTWIRREKKTNAPTLTRKSRVAQQEKSKERNRFLNIAILVVLLLLILVAYAVLNW